MGGGVVSSSLSDMFDGYEAICVSLTGATGPCSTGNPSYIMYNKNGPASIDVTVPAIPTCTNRQYVYQPQTIGALSVRRKVFVPTNDRFIRWMDIFTNTSLLPVTFNMITSNNLGSDSNTIITGSSSGDNAAQTNDLWVATFQNYSGVTSSDPRIGHVLQGTGAPTPVSLIHFANGDDNPYWGFTITLAPGQTKIIVNYATGQGSKAAAATQAANLAAYGANAQQCMSATELAQVVNFAGNADLAITKTANQPIAYGGFNISYTLAVTKRHRNRMDVQQRGECRHVYGGQPGGWCRSSDHAHHQSASGRGGGDVVEYGNGFVDVGRSHPRKQQQHVQRADSARQCDSDDERVDAGPARPGPGRRRDDPARPPRLTLLDLE